MGGNVVLLIVAIVVISAVVGAIAQFLNKLNEAKSPEPRRAARSEGSSQNERDMDRFLAEIDRLRKKNAETGETTSKPPVPRPLKAKPARQPRGEKVKPRVLAEVVEPQRRRVESIAMPALSVGPRAAESDPQRLPMATVVPTLATGVPTMRVTRLPQRERPSPKTVLAMNLTSLLNSGQGVAMAVILQEVLGPPKCKK